MADLIVCGKQKFMEKEIPVVLGGFGEGKKCICDKTIAEIHGMNTFDVRRRITDNIKRFKENIDFIDLKEGMRHTHTSEKQCIGENDTLELLQRLGYAKQSITQAEHIYLLSERGYGKLIKIMDTDLAWEIHDNIMDEYFQLKEEKQTGMVLPKDFPSALRAYADEYERNMLLEQKNGQLIADNQRMKPKEIFADAVSVSSTAILIGELAKILKQNGVDIGQNRLFEWLRSKEYLISRKGIDYNMPTQKSMELKLFEIKERTINNPDGSVRITKTVLVTGKGQQYFINKFLNTEERSA